MLKLGQEEKRRKTQMTVKFKKKVDHLRKKYNIDKKLEDTAYKTILLRNYPDLYL